MLLVLLRVELLPLRYGGYLRVPDQREPHVVAGPAPPPPAPVLVDVGVERGPTLLLHPYSAPRLERFL